MASAKKSDYFCCLDLSQVQGSRLHFQPVGSSCSAGGSPDSSWMGEQNDNAAVEHSLADSQVAVQAHELEDCQIAGM